MPVDSKQPMTGDALDRLAREWFAEARARTREDERAARCRSPTGCTTGDADGDVLDWLFGGDGANEDACDAGGGDGD